MMSAAKSRAPGLSEGKNSTMQSQSFSSCQYGSKSSLCFVPKMARPLSPEFLAQNSRYKNGTTKACSIALSVVPYRALQSDRCLVITTRYSQSAPFHGANAGSNPAGDANSIVYRKNVYSLFSKRMRNRGVP